MELIHEPFSKYLETGRASCSTIKKLKRSPLHWHEIEDKDTEAMAFGRMYHSFILEHKTFDKYYFVFDETDILEKLIGEESKKPRGTNAYKEWYEQQMVLAAGKIMVGLEDYEKINRMRSRLFANHFVKYLLLSGRQEVSAYGVLNNTEVKGRFDNINEKKRFITDLKTVADASEDGFRKYIQDFDGHIQPVMYLDLIEEITGDGMPWRFYWIAQEKTPPYDYGIYVPDAPMLAVGRYEYEMLLSQYQYCKETGNYEGYSVFIENKYGIREVSLPPWKIKDYQFYNQKK
jgi:exodeoxyribonuclease VIII